MRNVSKLSRVSFLFGSGAFLAACSTRGASLTPRGNQSALARSRDIPALTTATSKFGHTGFQLSSSASGHAIALHTAAGKFVYSLALGAGVSRHTYESGRQLVVANAVPRKKGWYHVQGGGTFRYVRSKTGETGVVVFPYHRSVKKLMYYAADNALILKSTNKVTARLEPRAMVGRSPSERLRTIADNPGLWTQDDDFSGAGAEYPAEAGFVKKKKKVKVPSGKKRAPRYLNIPATDTPTDPHPTDSHPADPYAGYPDPGPADAIDFAGDPNDVGQTDPYDQGTADPNQDSTDPPMDVIDVAMSDQCKQLLKALVDAASAEVDADKKAFQACFGKSTGHGKKSVVRATRAGGAKRPGPGRPRPKPWPHLTWECAKDAYDAYKARQDAAKAVQAAEDAGCETGNKTA